MGNLHPTRVTSNNVLGIDTNLDHVTLGQVWESRKEIENIVNYSREFLKHHFVPPTNETDFEAEVFYAKKLLAIIKPYSPDDLTVPEFKEKPPAFGETFSKISKEEYNIFLLETIEYVSNVLSRIRLIPFNPVEISQN